jgi:primosomal protein DnaI
MKLTKLKLNLVRTSENEKIRKQVMDEVMASKITTDFIAKNKLTTEDIDTNLGMVKRMVDDLKICQPCTSFHTCPKDVKGYQIRLDTNHEFFEVEYVKCSKLLDYEKIANHYTIKNFPNNWVDNRLVNVSANNYRAGLIKLATDLLAKRINNLYIYGASGLGKSHIAAAICNEFIDIHGGKLAFVNTHDLIEELRSLVYDDKILYSQKIKELEMVDLLVFDDIGNEKITEWSKEEVLFGLIDTRARNNKQTIYTSSYSVADLRSLYIKDSIKAKKLFEKFSDINKIFELVGVKAK